MRSFAIALLALWLIRASAADLDRPVILVAKPNLQDPLYGGSVLVVAPLGGGQHIGFIVNRPTDLTLGKIFPDHAPSQKIVDPVYHGGPVEPGLIFALVQRSTNPGGNSLEMMPGLYVAFEADVVDRIIEEEPEHARFMAGFVAWRPGELRSEVKLGAWDLLEAEPSLMMLRPEGLWEELGRRLHKLRNTI